MQVEQADDMKEHEVQSETEQLYYLHELTPSYRL